MFWARKIRQISGGGPLALVYDTRGFGTDSAATINANNGWLTFGLKPGAPQVWIDATNGLDTNNGTSYSTPVKTFAVGWPIYQALLAANPGAQLMIAGTGGRTYTDPGNLTTWMNNGGYSLQYPNAVLSYDPADPTNTAKYGKLVGNDVPHLIVPATGTLAFSCNGDTNTHFYAIQGISLESADDTSGGIQLKIIGCHAGFAIQNCRFIKLGINMKFGPSPNGMSQYIHISRSAFCGSWGLAWGSGASAIYMESADTPYIQDNVFDHSGWKIGASRNDTVANGGAAYYNHGVYLYPDCINARFDRNIGRNASYDTHNMRGGPTTCTQPVAWNEPVAFTMTGFSGGPSDQPSGTTVTIDDFCIIGGANVNDNTLRGIGFALNNSLAGSYARNGVAFDSPTYSNPYVASLLNTSWGGNIVQYFLVDKLHMYNYSMNLEVNGFDDATHLFNTFTNCLTDTLTPLHVNTVLTNCAVQSGYVGAQTPDQIVTTILTACGLTPAATAAARDAQLANLMQWRPDIQWALYIHGIALPAYGITPQYQTLATSGLPNLSAETPMAIFDGDTTAPVLSSPTATGGSGGTATIGATTNEGDGFLYWIVSTSSSPPASPTAYYIMQGDTGVDGSGNPIAATASGRQAISATGAQTINPGLPAGTYYAHMIQKDASSNANLSNVVSSASFVVTTRGSNILLGKTLSEGSGVTNPDGTTYAGGTFTAAANSNELASWLSVLQPNTSYTLTFDYDMTGGAGGIRAQDSVPNTLGTPVTFTVDSTTHSATITFTTPSSTPANSYFEMAANGGLYGPGTISNVYLSQP